MTESDGVWCTNKLGKSVMDTIPTDTNLMKCYYYETEAGLTLLTHDAFIGTWLFSAVISRLAWHTSVASFFLQTFVRHVPVFMTLKGNNL